MVDSLPKVICLDPSTLLTSGLPIWAVKAAEGDLKIVASASGYVDLLGVTVVNICSSSDCVKLAVVTPCTSGP